MSVPAAGESTRRSTLVAIGPTPRPRFGGSPDVYHYQLEPMARLWRTQAPLVRGLRSGLVVMVCAMTLGLPLLLVGLSRARMARRLDPLFERGTACEGEVVAVITPGGGIAEIVYAFTVAGARHTGHMRYPARLAGDWRCGDSVTVLHAPDDPGDSVGLFR
jgi:hypothetical protein